MNFSQHIHVKTRLLILHIFWLTTGAVQSVSAGTLTAETKPQMTPLLFCDFSYRASFLLIYTTQDNNSWKDKDGKELNNCDTRGSRPKSPAGVEYSEEWDLGVKFHPNINSTAVTFLVNVFIPSYFFLSLQA